MNKTIIGPDGVVLHLDKSLVVPNQPTAGLPARVEYKGKTVNYWHRSRTLGSQLVSHKAAAWLDRQLVEVKNFLWPH